MIKNETAETDLKTSDFYYDLPKELIAQHPAEKRDASRLLVMNRRTGELAHRMFYEITGFLNKGDVLVINDSKVIPARLFGRRLLRDRTGARTEKDGAAVEVMLLHPCEKSETASLPEDGSDEYGELWAALVRPGKRMRPGDRAVFSDELSAEVRGELDDGVRIVKLCHRRETGLYEILDRVGRLPLPPYITEEQDDYSRYQTVYAKYEGSAAAPTAGLHFTDELLEKIREKGIETAPVTLHVGLGTFRPVKEKNIQDHIMHVEKFSVGAETAEKINRAKKNGGRVIAVGTTSCRVLESVADENGYIEPTSDSTGIFIYPGYKFKIIDGLITNFHLPESTLIMLVSAFAGRENVLAAYKTAVEQKYRFFSFGDAMFIV
ncbi:MAG: tRNA preQ1(34) S-adenosylmethionine ribosyltransferase-isomerase QueA [Clostridia bacterium]|nr:tRNA preQ1(34) S-adenosylmethionine ribosyltransferase-isomerase QueA [Clostridia bacterium]